MRFTVKCSICDHGRFLATWPSVGYRQSVVCPSCNGTGRMRIPYSLMPQTLQWDKPCSGMFGHKKEYRCNRCDTAFSERELIEANRNNRSDTDFCPHCGVLEDWSENETIKGRVIRRWTYTPGLFKSMRLEQPSFPSIKRGAA